jgi:spore germination protein KC
MKRFKIILLIIIVLLTTSCWNYRALEDLAIVGALGIDIEKDEFVVSSEIVNPKKIGGTSTSGGNSPEETSIVVYKVKAKTIRDAINKMVLESPKALYVGHVNLLVIGEEAAKKGLKEFMDYFMRDTESRKIFTTVVVKGDKAINAIKILQPLESITSSNIQSSFDAAKQTYGTISNMQFDEIAMCLYTPGRQPTIAAIQIFGSPEEGEKNTNLSTTQSRTTIKIVGTGILKNDKLIDYIDEKEGLFYTLLRSKTNTLSLSFPCDDNKHYGNVVMDGIKSDVKVSIKKNKPNVSINVIGKAALTEYNCKINLREPKNINKIEEMISKELNKNIKNVIKKVQGFNSDIFGFGEKLYRNNYKYWKKFEDKWDKIFPTIPVKVKSQIKIERMSSTVDAAKK